MNKRKIFIVVIALILIATLITIYKIRNRDNTNQNKDISQDRENRIQEIYDYGNYVEGLDLEPNAIIARIDGEEILYHELETKRNSINYAGPDYENQNAFYELLKLKLYAKLEKAKLEEGKDESSIDIDSDLERTKNEWLNGADGKSAEEYRKEWLNVMGIEEDEIWLDEEDFIKYLQERMLELRLGSLGMSEIYTMAFEKTELVNDAELNEKINRHQEVENEHKNLINEGKIEGATENTKELITLYKEIIDIYTKDLILNMNIEFCADNHELSTRVPEINKK